MPPFSRKMKDRFGPVTSGQTCPGVPPFKAITERIFGNPEVGRISPYRWHPARNPNSAGSLP
jgi:hypothetical protein